MIGGNGVMSLPPIDYEQSNCCAGMCLHVMTKFDEKFFGMVFVILFGILKRMLYLCTLKLY